MTRKRALSQREISRMVSENIGMDVLDVEDVLKEFCEIACRALAAGTGISMQGLGMITRNPVATPGRRSAYRFKAARDLRLAQKSTEAE